MDRLEILVERINRAPSVGSHRPKTPGRRTAAPITLGAFHG